MLASAATAKTHQGHRDREPGAMGSLVELRTRVDEANVQAQPYTRVDTAVVWQLATLSL